MCLLSHASSVCVCVRVCLRACVLRCFVLCVATPPDSSDNAPPNQRPSPASMHASTQHNRVHQTGSTDEQTSPRMESITSEPRPSLKQLRRGQGVAWPHSSFHLRICYPQHGTVLCPRQQGLRSHQRHPRQLPRGPESAIRRPLPEVRIVQGRRLTPSLDSTPTAHPLLHFLPVSRASAPVVGAGVGQWTSQGQVKCIHRH